MNKFVGQMIHFDASNTFCGAFYKNAFTKQNRIKKKAKKIPARAIKPIKRMKWITAGSWTRLDGRVIIIDVPERTVKMATCYKDGN